MEDTNTQPEPSPLYQELKEMLYEEPATTGQRFLNYIIDRFLFYLIFLFVGGFLGFASVFTGGDPEELSTAIDNNVSPLMDLLITTLLLVLYYTFFETVTKGRTIGKMITGTRAVKEDGSNITPREALLRSLCRIVPFEPFSAFGGYPWHDKWTGTKVIKERR
jgi:uncharacterized RDD family membrane protein YckC